MNFSMALLLTLFLNAVAPSVAVMDKCPLPTPCAAPPPFCTWTGLTPDENGCLIGCGILMCEPNVDCSALAQCAAPPPFCRWTGPSTDANGCLIGCGSLVCDSIDDPIDSINDVCPPPPPCAAPPQGCSYPNPETDANGCLISCGSLFCCPALSCMAPGPGCSYGPQTVDAQGCSTSCGKLECKMDPTLCPVCSNPCTTVRCASGKKCVAKKLRKKKDRNGCKACATETKCVRRLRR
jgi:hypothetical protein